MARDGRPTNFDDQHRHYVGNLSSLRGGLGRGTRGRGRGRGRSARGITDTAGRLLVPRDSEQGSQGGSREPYSQGVAQITPAPSREATPAAGGESLQCLEPPWIKLCFALGPPRSFRAMLTTHLSTLNAMMQPLHQARSVSCLLAKHLLNICLSSDDRNAVTAACLITLSSGLS